MDPSGEQVERLERERKVLRAQSTSVEGAFGGGKAAAARGEAGKET